MRKLLIVLLIASASAHAATRAEVEACGQGVRAAYEAYMLGTFDAAQPDMPHLRKLLAFRLSQQPFPASELRAYLALGYITRRLKDAGVRAVHDYDVAAAAGEYIDKECKR